MSEDILAHTIRLPQQGERFFKTKQFEEKAWVPFLCRLRAGSVKWKKGVPRSWLIHPWDEVAYIIQKFLTYEGIFSVIDLYHIKLMHHLRGDYEISIPYFFPQSLYKMAKANKKRTEDTTTILFHCGLIKNILTHELQKQSLTWQKFVLHNEFEEPEEQLDDKLKEDEILMITYIEDDIQDSEETSSKQSKRITRTKSMVK